MMFKNKGSSSDTSKYRALCMLNHSYKLLSVWLLLRLVKETDLFLSQSQAGFRKNRGTRDNVAILRLLIDSVLEIGSSCVLTFVDFAAAFDTVSHKLLDEALAEAGASDKSRALFRAIY